jgi:starvation-inducible outer membrane lipoprotein
MGLFRRARKNREKAPAEVRTEPTITVEVPVEVASREVTAEARPDPDQPGWGPTIGQQTTTVEVPVEVASREVTAEARPNPDRPGWGRTIGQQIGKAREDRASQ